MRALRHLAVALIFAGGLAVAAQQPDTFFRDVTEVLVVNVDVTVTDRQGRPILGLGPEDFTVLEDGKPVEISNFSAIDQRRADATAPLSGEGEAAGAAGDGAAGEGLDLFVYVDNYNLVAKRRDRVLDALVEHLDRTLRPADRVTLIVHAGGHLGFPLRRSSSRPEIVAAVDAIRKMPAGGIDDRLLQRDTVRSIMEVFELYDGDVCRDAEGVFLSIATAYAGVISQHVEASVLGLETLVRVLSAVEGRKPVLHVSDGFAAQPGLGMFLYLEDLCGTGRFWSQAAAFDETGRLAELTASANANRVTFFPLQASGLAGSSDFGASTAMVMRQNLLQPLQVMAAETGGRAVFNTNDFAKPLQALDGDVRAYYSIGYSPPERSAGDREGDRRIEVRLAREVPGADLRFRRRYGLKTADERLAERTLGALYGFEENSLGVSLTIGDLAGASPPRVLLRLAVPREVLTYILREDRWECEIDLVIGYAGESGGETRQRRITLTAERNGSGPPSGVETLEVAVGASPGTNRFAVAVADVVSSRIATVAETVEVAGSAGP